VFDLTPENLQCLSAALSNYNWSAILLALDMCCSGSQFTEIYDDFIKIIK